MLTSSIDELDTQGRATRRSRITRGLLAGVGAVALASGALAFSAAPAFAATPDSGVVHTEQFPCQAWQVGCPYPPVQVLASPATPGSTAPVASIHDESIHATEVRTIAIQPVIPSTPISFPRPCTPVYVLPGQVNPPQDCPA